MIESYAELKRKLIIGAKLKLTFADNPGHKYLNSTRAIEKVQTNGVKFEGGSWLGLGMYGEKASDYTFQVNGFTVNYQAKPMLSYEFV